jgi:hypothetical protein
MAGILLERVPAICVGEAEWACKPDPVVDDHLSGTDVAVGLSRAYPSAGRASLSRSYLPLLRVGFAKPPRCRDAGALLPHRFSFSWGGEPLREFSFLWHFPSARAALPLAGTLPCGVRTFLTPRFRDARPSSPLRCTVYPVRKRTALVFRVEHASGGCGASSD